MERSAWNLNCRIAIFSHLLLNPTCSVPTIYTIAKEHQNALVSYALFTVKSALTLLIICFILPMYNIQTRTAKTFLTGYVCTYQPLFYVMKVISKLMQLHTTTLAKNDWAHNHRTVGMHPSFLIPCIADRVAYLHFQCLH